MAIQKKHGKGRLDKWYKLAKEKGLYDRFFAQAQADTSAQDIELAQPLS